MFLNRLLRSVSIRIHKLSRYTYKGFANSFNKKRVYFDGRNSYFDPFVIQINNSVHIVCSDRKNNSVICFDTKKTNETKTLLKPKKGRWDEVVNRACVVKHGNKFYMWYTGQKCSESKIGLAVSLDGILFERISDNPVLFPTLSEEKKSVMNPSVIFDSDSNLFKMWYSGGDFYEPDCIFYAESKDGIAWSKNSIPVLTKSKNKYDCYKVGGCDVIKIDKNRYIMHYIGYQNIDLARVCVAISSDGINWSRSNKNPIICPSRNNWDADSCYKPSYYNDHKNNEHYIFYNGRKGNIEQIGCVSLGKNYENEI